MRVRLLQNSVFSGQYADNHCLRRGGGGACSVSALDPREPAAPPPRGQVDFAQGFLRRRDLSDGRGSSMSSLLPRADKVYTFGRLPGNSTQPHSLEFWMIEPEPRSTIRTMRIGGSFVNTPCGVVTKGKKSAFFDERIEKGVANSRHRRLGIVQWIREQSRARAGEEKFEFRRVGIDCSRRRALSSPKSTRKKPVIVMNYPKPSGVLHAVNHDGRTVARWTSPGDREDHRRQPARRSGSRYLDAAWRRGIDREHHGWYRDLTASRARHHLIP